MAVTRAADNEHHLLGNTCRLLCQSSLCSVGCLPHDQHMIALHIMKYWGNSNRYPYSEETLLI